MKHPADFNELLLGRGAGFFGVMEEGVADLVAAVDCRDEFGQLQIAPRFAPPLLRPKNQAAELHSVTVCHRSSTIFFIHLIHSNLEKLRVLQLVVVFHRLLECLEPLRRHICEIFLLFCVNCVHFFNQII